MIDLFLGAIRSPYAAILIFLSGVAIVAIHEIFIHIRSYSAMRIVGFPRSRKIRLLTLSEIAKIEVRNREITKTWLMSKAPYGYAYAAATILSLGATRAIIIDLPTEFSRAGSILVLVGLLGTIFCLREGHTLKRRWQDVVEICQIENSQDGLIRHMDDLINRAVLRSTAVYIIISIVGTVSWAYGDQVIGCAIFPMLGRESVCDFI